MANKIENKEEVTLEKVVMAAMKAPGVKINRAKFLRKELLRYCKEAQLESAIEGNPAKAGISKDIINKISLQVINYESTKVTALSAVASIPGGAAALGSAVVDITSYYAFILRIVQELAYLYGFPQFDLNEEDIDSETLNYLFLFVGVMFGVQGASSALRQFSNILAKNISKKLARKALTKGAVYPLVKKIAKLVGIRMTKQIFADSVASAVPLAGGLISGGLTYAMFKPGCMKLRRNLMSYNICDPGFYKGTVDADYVDSETMDDSCFEERNHQNAIIDIIIENAGSLKTNVNKVFISPDIPEKKLKNAIEAYAAGIKPEDVLALVDTNLFGNADEGLLFTEDAVYFSHNSRKFYYSDIQDIEMIPNHESNRSVGKKESEPTVILVLHDGGKEKMDDYLLRVSGKAFYELIKGICGEFC